MFDVSGPVAIITIPSFIKFSKDVTSFLIISIFSMFSKIFVTFSENFSLSTANACPAGTAVSSATFISKLSNILNSSFNKPHAFVCKFDLNELLHTISAKFLFVCALENSSGFISYSFTFIPAFAIWYAASHPAKPPPIIVI